MLDHLGGDPLLFGVPLSAAALADVHEPSLRPGVDEHLGADQGVVHDHVRLAQQFLGGQRQQAGVAGPRADQRDLAGPVRARLGLDQVRFPARLVRSEPAMAPDRHAPAPALRVAILDDV